MLLGKRRRCLIPTNSLLPPTCALEVTYACNHSCPYCSCPWRDPRGQYPVGTPLSAASWVQTIATLVKRGISNFILTGGEPTLLPDFDHLTATLAHQTTVQPFYISSEGCQTRQYPVSFVILTNGDTGTWTSAFCRSLAGTRCRVHVHVAGLPEIHNALTGGDYARTLRTIQHLLDAKVDLVVNFPLLQENLGVVGKALEEVLAMGVRQVNMMRILPVGIARASSTQWLPPAAFLQAYHEIAATCHKYGATCGVGSLVPSCAFPGDYLDTFPHVCGCGTRSFCIDPAGLVRPCTCSPVIGGNLNRLEDALASEVFCSFLQRSHPHSCNGCSRTAQCSGGCPAVWYGETSGQAGDPWITTPFYGGSTA